MEEMEMAHVYRLAEIAATGEYVSVTNDKISEEIGLSDPTTTKKSKSEK
jgi:hypothetical protein